MIDYFCSGSWTDVNINFFNRLIRHCCKSQIEKFPKNLTIDFFNSSPGIIKRRIDSLNNLQNDQCVDCWDDYKLTGTSYKDLKNSWKSLNDFSKKISYIEIKLDNICDLSCVYCGPEESTKIAYEQGIKKVNQNKFLHKDLDVFFEWLDTIDLNNTYISFLGGEPIYSNNFYLFVNKLKENNADKFITLNVLTNGNTSSTYIKKVDNLLNNLPNNWKFVISFSNESFGGVSELIRWGLDWDRFCKNFEFYIKHSRLERITIVPTINIFSIKSLFDFFSWVFKILQKYNKKTLVYGNWVVTPTELDIARCPYEYKEKINEVIKLFYENECVNSNFDLSITWLEKMKDRVATKEQDYEMLDRWFDRMYTFKKDNKIFNLKKFL